MATTTESSPQSPHTSQLQSTPDQPISPFSTIPPLTTSHATDLELRTTALHLVSDSVAQQRQLAAQSLIFHPLILAFWIACLAVIHQFFYKGKAGDLAIVLTTGAGVTMAGLLGVRWCVGGYLVEAERVGTWSWLDGGEGRARGDDEDEILVTSFGEEVIGAVVLRGVRDTDSSGSGAGKGGKKRQRSHSGSGGHANSHATGKKSRKGVIRAWTVRQKYRGKGVGGALLEETVKLCQEQGWTGPVFATDHANSARVLPGIFNGGFEARERKARAMLEKCVEELHNVNAGKGAMKGRR